VGRSEWFVFRRYAEFDKLYNTVSNNLQDFYLKQTPEKNPKRKIDLDD
jgi:hypothetical protein